MPPLTRHARIGKKLKGNAILVVEEGSVRISRDKDDGRTTKGSSRRGTYPELVRRLDEALLSFDEGPPFTLQRLYPFGCKEYLPKALSKLALALEKNLLVTSMLSISMEPQSQPTEEANAATEDTKTAAENGTQPNGIEAVVGGDKDEIMSKILLITLPPAEGNYFKGLSVVGCCC
ncbi:hypothetical protein Bca52824_005232 [Brassica carinata]|uniref:Uncharacterized protein n=1 Tax=Brassica carinata TaxID=52824 RepID=A0A8X7WR67_BRACI|nr:hypothetical protein Bca52824_005232 [Brassica carinata]